MTDKKIPVKKASDGTDRASVAVNEVRLVGRLSQRPGGAGAAERRLGVDVPGRGRRRPAGRQDQAAAWTRSSARSGVGACAASVASWAADDVVEVTGPLRTTVLPRRWRGRRRGSRSR